MNQRHYQFHSSLVIIPEGFWFLAHEGCETRDLKITLPTFPHQTKVHQKLTRQGDNDMMVTARKKMNYAGGMIRLRPILSPYGFILAYAGNS